MAHKAKTKFSFWHLVALGTVSTGLLLSADFSAAQEKETKNQSAAKDDKEVKKDEKEPLAEKSAPLPPYPTFPKLTIVGKTPEEKQITEQVVKSINQKLEASWKENKIVPSGFINDYEFIRRVSLDVVGRIASPEEITKYMRYPQTSRRSQIIEDLLASEDYPRHWANHFTNWF